MLKDLPIGWQLYVIAVWTVAIAFIVFALIVLLPELLKEIAHWSRETFGRKPAPVIPIDAHRRQQLSRLVQAQRPLSTTVVPSERIH